jgi:hypothetical protein
MAMASSASLVVVCSSSFFVKGTAVSSSSSSSLRLSPSVAAFGISNGGGSRITAMATKKVSARPKFSGGKKSWLPGVKGGGNLVDPEWLDGSYVTTYTSVSRVQACWISASCDFSEEKLCLGFFRTTDFVATQCFFFLRQSCP